MADRDAYSILAARHEFGDSPGYRMILEFLMTPEQAELVAELPKPIEELARMLNRSEASIKEDLDLLYEKGVVLPRNFETREGYRFARDLAQLRDATQSLMSPLNRRLYDEVQEKEFYRRWEDFMRQEWEPRRTTELMQRPKPKYRILPAYKAVKDPSVLLPLENVRELMKEQQTIAVVACACRSRKGAVGDPCDRDQPVTCLQFNRGAEYAINRGSGRQLTLEETLELCDQVETSGLVHIWPDSDTLTPVEMCNCCPDCCVNLLPMAEYGVPFTKYYTPSRFESRVDTEPCSGCQDCVERCPFGAIDMMRVLGSKRYKAVVDSEKCMGCGLCVLVCAPEALSLEVVRPPEHIPSLSLSGASSGALV